MKYTGDPFWDEIEYQDAKMRNSREVCKRRARVLRQRGELVRYSHDTATGKPRYVWAKA